MYRNFLVLAVVLICPFLHEGSAVADEDTVDLSSYYRQHPLGIRAESMGFDHGESEIFGTLFLPTEENPSVVIVAASGSGNVSYRESWRPGATPFWKTVVEYLVSNGSAVFLYDKPGVGLSRGNWVTQTIEQRADELLSAFDLINERFHDNAVPKGLLGFSEGGLVAELASAGNRDVSFVITLSTPAIAMKKVLIDEGICLLQCRGVYGIEASLRSAAISVRFNFIELISMIYRPYNHTYYTIRYNPTSALRMLEQPMLSILAENDCTVDAEKNIESLRRFFGKDSFNDALFIEVVDGADHLFRISERCNGPLKKVTAPGLLTALGNEGFWGSILDR